MKLDKHSIPYFEPKDIMQAMYAGIDLSSLNFVCDDCEELNLYNSHAFEMGYSELSIHKEADINTSDLDKQFQSEWLMPSEYRNFDIIEWLVSNCGQSEDHVQRMAEELAEFAERGWLDLLRWLKYFVDICRENNIVCGVGRGSSVSSYVLYVIGIHKIDPVKYNLDWKEFLR